MTSTSSRGASGLLVAALGAAARGFPVAFMRLTDDGKFPAIRSAHRDGDPQRGRCRGECGRLGHGIYDATTDEGRILEMHEASRFPNGYAVACGRDPHRVLGLDLDRKNGADGVALLAQIAESIGFKIPATITVTTPTGGRHVWLELPPGARVRNSVGKLGGIDAPGIDVRSVGGQLVGPGSCGPKGAYRLECVPDTPLAPVPGALLDLLTVRDKPRGASFARSTASSSKRIAGLVATVLDAKPGSRNAVLFWSACRMAEAVAEGGLGDNEARELLLTAAERIGLDHSEAAVSIDSAFRTSHGRA